MFVDHLCHCVAQQDHVLVKRFDLTLQFDAIDQVNGDRYMLFAKQIEKRVLQKLAFVVHDMFRVRY